MVEDEPMSSPTEEMDIPLQPEMVEEEPINSSTTTEEESFIVEVIWL